MPSRFWLKLAAAATAVALLAAMVQAWRADRRDRSQLAGELAATKQLLAAADSRQHDRDAQLAQTLATLAAEKRTIVTPAQIIRELPNTIPLPVPITLQTAQQPGVAQSTTNKSAGTTAQPAQASGQQAQQQAVIPAEDLKPLYDFTLDCKACQAKFAAAQSDLADERQKTAALTKERDDAVRIAKGGSGWRRATRAAKWFLLGAAAGAIAAKTAR